MKSVALIVVLGIAVAVFQPATSLPQNNKGSLRIVGGNEAPPGEIPYNVFIESSKAYACGGALITEDWVLTAASCVEGAVFARLTLGVTNFSNPEEGSKNLFSSKIIVHEKYAPKANDIALVKLPESIEESDSIKKIALPKDPTTTFAGLYGQLSGRGSDTASSPYSLTSHLRYYQDIILTNDECKKKYSDITDEIICINNYEQKPACNGDIGGPLASSDGNNLVLVGLVTPDFGLCDTKKPIVFTRVSPYLQWIQDTMSKN